VDEVNAVKLEEYKQWLDKEGLLAESAKHTELFKHILTQNLGLKDEKLLIIGDKGYPDKRCPAILIGCYAIAAKELGLDFDIVLQGPKNRGDVAEDEVIESMLELEDKSVIIMCLSGVLGSMNAIGKSYRKFAKSRGHRFISTPSLNALPTERFPMLIKAFNVNAAALEKKGALIKEALDAGKEISIKTRKGTDVTINIEGMKAILNSGLYTEPGTGGNLPAGEVYVPPAPQGVNGTFVLDGSVKTRESCIILDKPVTLTVENSRITSIVGNTSAGLLDDTLRWAEQKAKFPQNIRLIGELGIGINPSAKIIGPTIVNEKALGTAHVAIGSNSWFGGNIYTIIHLDQVFYEPIIKIDGKLLRI